MIDERRHGKIVSNAELVFHRAWSSIAFSILVAMIGWIFAQMNDATAKIQVQVEAIQRSVSEYATNNESEHATFRQQNRDFERRLDNVESRVYKNAVNEEKNKTFSFRHSQNNIAGSPVIEQLKSMVEE